MINDPRSYTPEEDAVVTSLWSTQSARHISDIISRSAASVRERVKRLNLPRKRPRKVWTKEEEAALAAMAKEKFDISAIAKKLGRSEGSIRIHASKKLIEFRSDRHLKSEFRGKSFYHSLKGALTRSSAGSRCCLCDYEKHIDLHHIDGDNSNHSRGNIASLCPNHHREVEAGEHPDAVLFCIWWRVYSDGRRTGEKSTRALMIPE